jgi:cytochrome b subunit of formate dehydrogenase
LFCLPAAGILLAQEAACADCHEVDSDPIFDSPHGFLECSDCHSGFDETLHPEEMSAPVCADCHDDVAEELSSSVHGQESAAALFSSGCSECHGSVHEMSECEAEHSPVCREHLAETCGSCHADPELADRFRFRLVQPLEAYLASVHAVAVGEGHEGPTCGSCHGDHGIRAAADPESTVHRMRVPETCGGCHTEITETFQKSVHGQAAAVGVSDSPVCTDCHGEHRIVSPAEEGSPVFATNIPKMTCGRCHADLRLGEKFGLDQSKVPSYEDSYHGLAGRGGAVTVAHCGSCHGIHDILPSSDPASHIHKDNLAETCGSCHPGAGQAFAIGTVHVLATEEEHLAVYWIRRIYLALIFLVIGGMVLHNSLDLYRKARRPNRQPARLPNRIYRLGPMRMSLVFRVTHALLLSSFFVLVYTGFALKFPEAWWSGPLLHWEGTFGLRGWLHRVAAVVMLLATALHAVHLAMSRRARRDIAAFIPTRADWHELRARVSFLFGGRKSPPPAPSVGYPEKMEYLAVIWGTVLMAVTGFMLWFDDAMLKWFPKWFTDVATVIHLYEAILASLAILVWHFYFVIFDPLVYPMDPAWLTGRSANRRLAERLEGHQAEREARDE